MINVVGYNGFQWLKSKSEANSTGRIKAQKRNVHIWLIKDTVFMTVIFTYVLQ